MVQQVKNLPAMQGTQGCRFDVWVAKRYLSRLERRAEYFVSPRDEALPRVSLECNPEIPVAPGEEH